MPEHLSLQAPFINPSPSSSQGHTDIADVEQIVRELLHNSVLELVMVGDVSREISDLVYPNPV